MKPEERRAELFYMFEWLRGLGVTCFLISECNPDLANCTYRDEAYLADGVVLLKMAEIGDTDVHAAYASSRCAPRTMPTTISPCCSTGPRSAHQGAERVVQRPGCSRKNLFTSDTGSSVLSISRYFVNRGARLSSTTAHPISFSVRMSRPIDCIIRLAAGTLTAYSNPFPPKR